MKRIGGLDTKIVHAHSDIQAITYYCHMIIKEPWRENDFEAVLIEAPAKRQPAAYRKRLEKYWIKLDEHMKKYQ